MTALGREAFAGTALEVAPTLLGALLVHTAGEARVVLRLTEVEAYLGQGEDPGSHAFRGRTPRTAVMFGPAGHLYVYFTYGMHWCANVVCGPDGTAGAVLLRAGEVVEGVELARARRTTSRRDADLARGPARLTTAMGLGAAHNGVDLCAPGGAVRLLAPPAAVAAPLSGPRVGVSGPGGDAATFPWRFWLPDESTVSTYRRGQVRRRQTPSSSTRTV